MAANQAALAFPGERSVDFSTRGSSPEERASFADTLRQARLSAALSQEKLAERAGLSARGVSDLERGIHPTPRLETVRMLATALALDEASRSALLAAARSTASTSAAVGPRFVALPVPLTRLVGREQEVVEIGHVLRDDSVRLLTLTGTGGSGKTRLAIAAADTLSDDFADGVAFVDLSPLANPALVPATVVQALELKNTHGLDPEEALQAHLLNRRVLLVLDNFEHLLAAAPFATRLLSAAPGVKVLATSREPLRLRGEREFAVPSLALPEPMTSPVSSSHIARLGRCGAVALFVARAHDARRDFNLSMDNAEAVAEICRRLDGLPLALELAAARIRVLSPHALLERLGPALPVLTSGSRDAPARQHSLRDTIAWSYRLLTKPEQTMFRSVGRFVGGWTLDAAEAIADPHEDLNVFVTLSSLVEKNLVRVDHEVVEPRYTMLETIREYALELLAASGEDHAVRDRHARWCLALCEESEPALEGFGGAQVQWLARLDREVGNIGAALTWLDHIGDARRLLRLVTVLDTFWPLRPQHAEVETWLERGLRASDVPASTRAHALNLAVTTACYQGDWSKAMTYAQDSLAAAEAWGDSFGLGRAHYDLGDIWLSLGDAVRAEALFAQAVTLFREASAASWVYLALSDLGSARQFCGDIESAVQLLDEALALVRQPDQAESPALQDGYGLCQVLGKRAYAARERGDLVLATQMFFEKLTIAKELGASREELGALAGIAGILLDCGQAERAARLLGAVDSAREAEGLAHIAHFLFAKQLTAVTCDALGEAAFNAHWREGRAMPLEHAVADAVAEAEQLKQ
jgi:predicted ATPase/transcriptional regulator with XRE-family HTH domain